MSPILGIWASAQQLAFAGNYDSIATVTVGAGGASSITFSSIPSTYKHLQVRGIANTGSVATGGMTFNGDTGANYKSHYLYGDGASAVSGVNASNNSMYAFLGISNANIFGGTIIDILDYTNTNKNTTIRSLSGGDVNGATGYIELLSGVWFNTNAVTSITLTPASGNFSQYSHFALYGIKG